MLPIYGPHSMGDIPPGSELLLYPFPAIRAIRAVQVFVFEFSKDGFADLGYKYADGGAAILPVLLPEVLVSPMARCSSIIASFSPTSNGFLKLVTDFLMWWCMCYDPNVKLSIS